MKSSANATRVCVGLTICAAGLAVALLFRPTKGVSSANYQPVDVLKPEFVDYEPAAETLPDSIEKLRATIASEIDFRKLPLTNAQKSSLSQAMALRVRALVAFDKARDSKIFVDQGDRPPQVSTNNPMIDRQYELFRGTPLSTSKVFVSYFASGDPTTLNDTRFQGFSRSRSAPADNRLQQTGSGSYATVLVPMMCKTVEGKPSAIVQLVGFSFKWSPNDNKWLIMEGVKYGDQSSKAIVPAIPISFY